MNRVETVYFGIEISSETQESLVDPSKQHSRPSESCFDHSKQHSRPPESCFNHSKQHSRPSESCFDPSKQHSGVPDGISVFFHQQKNQTAF